MVKRILASLVFSVAGPALAQAAVPDQTPTPDPVADGIYQPKDKDERGLWMVMEEEERKLQTSNFVIRDPALNAYVRDSFCRMVGEQCKEVRIYITRTPYFNASMAPNGLMIVYSGLFLRARDEAQMAAVLGHEFVHYKNRHSLRIWRDVKSKTNALGFLSIIPVASWAALGAVSALQIGIAGSVYSFSRDMEREADTGSIALLARANYDPQSASRIWEQLRAEMDATAAARGKKSEKNKDGGLFATHPPTAERMAELRTLAEKATLTGNPVTNRAAYVSALAPFWAGFVDDQVKLNDFGGTELLLGQLAADGWTPQLLFARGELYRARAKTGDFELAAGFYREATKSADAPVEAWRGLGLSLMRAGKADEGKPALKKYLELAPRATDRAMMAMLAGEAQ